MSLFKKITFALGLVIIIAVGYILFPFATKPEIEPELKIVEVETVQLGKIQQTAKLIGQVTSEKYTKLIAQSSGTLNIFVQPGQKLKKGDRIAKLENNNLERNYVLMQEAEKIAELQYDRMRQLSEQGIISKNSAEEKKDAWINAQKTVSDAKIALDQCDIRAPFAGIIGIFKYREGSQIQQGNTLAILYDPSHLIAEFDVPSPLIPAVHDGGPVLINQKPYAITHIQKILDDETRMSPAYTNIACDDCIIGSTLDVDLVVQQKTSAIAIPYESVFLRDGKPFVYLVKANKAILTAVALGIRDKASIEVVSGIQKGDMVIIRGPERLSPDTPVKIYQPSQTPSLSNNPSNGS